MPVSWLVGAQAPLGAGWAGAVGGGCGRREGNAPEAEIQP